MFLCRELLGLLILDRFTPLTLFISTSWGPSRSLAGSPVFEFLQDPNEERGILFLDEVGNA